MPGLPARLREEVGLGNHITRLCVTGELQCPLALWLLGLGRHPFSAFLGQEPGVVMGFQAE